MMTPDTDDIKRVWMHVPGPVNDLRAFIATPPSPPPWPALIVLHGVNGAGLHMEEKALAFTRDGYLAIVPDLYADDPDFASHRSNDILIAAHLGPDRERWAVALREYPLTDRADVERARAWMDRRQTATFIETVRHCYDAVVARDDVRAVGCLGYCMGGRLAGQLAASGVALAATVVYYGAPPPNDRISFIRSPIQGHYAASDHAITDKIPAFAEAMKAAGKSFESYLYAAAHGFSLLPGGLDYDAEATRISLERIRPFLSSHLNVNPVSNHQRSVP